ncbi:MAG: endonuclease/exonuclease/phosphatase family protein [Chloroflexota bacterium]
MVHLSVMTFNIRGAPEGDGPNAWEHRARLNTHTIRRYMPDLIGFQELQPENLATYQLHLPEYRFLLGRPSNRSERMLYNTIAWKPDLLEMVENSGFYLSQTPYQWSVGWDAARVRVANWAQFRILRHPIEFMHINTHFDHIGEQARQEGARAVIKAINNLHSRLLPVILTGDFNCPAADGDGSETSSPAYRLLRGEGFEDCYLLGGYAANGSSGTFHGFQGADFPASTRMDWIMTLDGEYNIKTRFCQIIQDAAPPLYPSDHYPVLANLQIQPEFSFFSRQTVTSQDAIPA